MLHCINSITHNLAGLNLKETITAKRAFEIIAMNKQGEKPLSLLENDKAKTEKKPVDLLADADVSRFDKAKKKKNKKNKNNKNNKQAAPKKTQDGAAPQAQNKPKEAKANDRQRDGKPMTAKQNSGKSSDSKPATPKQNSGKPSDSKPATTKQKDGKPNDSKPATEK